MKDDNWVYILCGAFSACISQWLYQYYMRPFVDDDVANIILNFSFVFFVCFFVWLAVDKLTKK